ncbi:hypothetical protein EV191_108226 [Tamaricihabitans halophyticus]|uniref:Uncharacterized protein n=1 Tax=Tamaricihabitans halophyticus TaxID=1262583 RepID=A0A4R2QLA6_9PSEU|nr:hypothetical protein [Tamaricihabitans halophyticus]TCP50137.1 hypothetical protein EV191_108226 [Tamaricihabitans halophyticus]
MSSGGRRTEIVVDDAGVRRELADGSQESVSWDDLRRVGIRTIPDGPWDEDVFFLLEGENGTGCAVPSGHPSANALMSKLQVLPGFDNDVFVEAMTTTDDALFICWQRT